MTAIRSAISSAVRNVISSAVLDDITRLLTYTYIQLEAPLQSHYEYAKDEVLTGDFDIGAMITTTSDSGIFVFSGGTGADGLELYKYTHGKLTIYYGGNSLGGGGNAVVSDGIFHWVELRRRGTEVKLYIDGVLTGTVTISGDCRIRNWGRRMDAAFYWQGYISKPFVTDYTRPIGKQRVGFDLNNKVDMNEYGADLWANPIFDNQWSDNGDGSYTLTGDGSFSQLYVELPENNQQYLLEFDYTSDGNLSARVDGSTLNTSTSSIPVGTNLSASVKCVANSAGNTQIGVARLNGGQVVNATISNIHLRRIDVTAFNNIEYSKDVTFGVDIVPTTPFLGAGSGSVDGNTISNTTTDWFYGYKDLTTEIGKTYRYRIDFIAEGNSDVASIRAWDKANDYVILVEYNLTKSGYYELLFTATSTETRIGLQGVSSQVGNSVTFKSVDVMEIVTGNALIYNKIPDSNRNQYAQDGNDWVGTENVITNGTFDGDFGWNKTGGAAIAGGIGIIDGTGGQTLLFQAAVEQGSYYRGRFEANVIVDAPTNELWNNDGGDIVSITQGINEIVDYQYPSDSEFLLFRSNGGHYTTDDFELYRVLKTAPQTIIPPDPVPQAQGGEFGTLTYFNTLEAL